MSYVPYSRSTSLEQFYCAKPPTSIKFNFYGIYNTGISRHIRDYKRSMNGIFDLCNDECHFVSSSKWPEPINMLSKP